MSVGMSKSFGVGFGGGSKSITNNFGGSKTAPGQRVEAQHGALLKAPPGQQQQLVAVGPTGSQSRQSIEDAMRCSKKLSNLENAVVPQLEGEETNKDIVVWVRWRHKRRIEFGAANEWKTNEMQWFDDGHPDDEPTG